MSTRRHQRTDRPRPRLLTEAQVLKVEDLATHVREHELTLLACALRFAAVAQRIASDLRVDDFGHPETQAIAGAVVALVERSVNVTELSVTAELKRQWGEEAEPYIRELAAGAPLVHDAKHSLEVVKDASIRRQGLRALREAAAAMIDLECKAPLSAAYDALMTVDAGHQGDRIRHIGDVVADQVRAIEAAHEAAAAGRSPLATTGFPDLDERLVMAGGKLIVCAARPGMGKSALSVQVAMHVAQERPVVLVTLEMTGEEIAGRLINATLRLNGRDQAAGRVGAEMWEALQAYQRQFEASKLWVVDPAAVTMAGIGAAVRQVAAKAGAAPGLVVVDYLGLVDAEGENETAKAGAISKASKRLAMELRCPVWMLCQLNRGVEQRADKRPMLSDLRQSGAIEQDADAVLFLYRDDYYHPNDSKFPNTCEVLIPKNRGGATSNDVRLFWRAAATRFESLAATPAPTQGPGPLGGCL